MVNLKYPFLREILTSVEAALQEADGKLSSSKKVMLSIVAVKPKLLAEFQAITDTIRRWPKS